MTLFSSPAPIRRPNTRSRALLQALLGLLWVLTLVAPQPAHAQTPAPAEQTQAGQEPASQAASPQPAGEAASTPAGTQGEAQPAASPASSAESAAQPRAALIVAAQIDEQRKLVAGWKATVDGVEAALRRHESEDTQLNELRREMDPIRNQAPAVIVQLQDRVKTIEARITQLGDPPADGEPAEPSAVREERQALNAALGDVRGVLSQARVILVQSEQLEARISEYIRDQFAAKLSARSRTPIDPTLWDDVIEQLPLVYDRFALLIGEGSRAAWNNLTPTPDRSAASINASVLSIAFSIFIGIVLVVVGRRKLAQLYARVPRDSEPTRLEKYAGATWLFVTDALVPAISLFLVLVAIQSSGLLPDRLMALVRSVFTGIWFFLFPRALIIAVLAPRVPSWRLVQMSQHWAVLLSRILLAMTAILGLDEFFDTAFDLIIAPLQTEIARSGSFALLTAFLGMWGLRVIARGRPGHSEDEADEDARTGSMIVEAAASTPSAWLRVFYWAVFLSIAIAALIGYVALASYTATHIVLASSIVALTGILMAFTDELSSTLVSQARGPKGTLARSLGLSRSTMDQIIILVSGAFRLFLVICAAVLVMVPWGFDTWQWNSWVRSAFFGIQVGEIVISPSAIISALAVFAIGLLATRTIRAWLENKYLPRTRMDIGLKSSVSTAFGYLGMLAAAAIAASFAGFDLANLAIVARGAVARHRLRPAVDRQQLRVRPDPAGRAPGQGRRLDPRVGRGRLRAPHQRARHRNPDLRAFDGHRSQLRPDIRHRQEHDAVGPLRAPVHQDRRRLRQRSRPGPHDPAGGRQVAPAGARVPRAARLPDRFRRQFDRFPARRLPRRRRQHAIGRQRSALCDPQALPRGERRDSVPAA